MDARICTPVTKPTGNKETPVSKCPHCSRRFRSKAAEQLADRRRAVILDLRGEAPAEHLRPEPFVDRQMRHQQDSAAFRASLT